MSRTPDSFVFEGFSAPNYTQVPDEFFDRVMQHLGDAELRVVLYVFRRTFGFKKQSDPISFNQFLHGITKQDGEVLDCGCGLTSPTTLSNALKGLEAKGIIESQKHTDAKGGRHTTVYLLRFAQEGTTRNVVGGTTPRVDTRNSIQETVKQETVTNHPPPSDGSIRKETREPTGSQAEIPAHHDDQALSPNHVPQSSARTSAQKAPDTTEQLVLRGYLQDLRQRFADNASENSTLTRVWHLYEQAQADYPRLTISTFIGHLEHAAAITEERHGELKYLFGVVDSLLWPPEPTRRAATPSRGNRRRKSIAGPYVRVDYLYRGDESL